ncbi:polar amino acid transport system substrate-binding protein [Formivibrio citricus]|uniref:Polar amino acid transport system substrate-binding protein n=1 Tax=Formivibrio citricus TaxID=83765 RepID=A0A1I5DYX9_9NEIS|nr:ABC transporter substrate-binding protein [Formivibrio citricus]SFO04061.1 polar amino acid transport system substrate-binding protein [Formivibrio citricus]
MNTASHLANALAPEGVLRVSINYGNPVLAHRDAKTGAPAGISVDIALELARRLGVTTEFVTFDAARKSVEALESGVADIGFFAADPSRSKDIHFTAPYLMIEGCYLVRECAPVKINDDVDQPGIKVAVGKGSAYDLFLSRNLKHAEIVRADNPALVIEVFKNENIDVAAGVKQQLLADMKKMPGLRMLDGRFMEIHQALALPAAKGSAACEFMDAFAESIKRSGFITEAIHRHGIPGVNVPGIA